MIISVNLQQEKKKMENEKCEKGGDGALFIPWPKRKRKSSMVSHCLNVEKLPLNVF